MMKNRRGIFRISKEVLDNDWWVVLKLMSKVIVIRAEYILMNDYVVYHAYSPEFREVPDNETSPLYHIEVRTIIDIEDYLTGHEINFVEAKQ